MHDNNSALVNFSIFVKVNHAHAYIEYNFIRMSYALIKNERTLYFTQFDANGSLLILGDTRCSEFPYVEEYQQHILEFEKEYGLESQMWSIFTIDNNYLLSKENLMGTYSESFPLPFKVPDFYTIQCEPASQLYQLYFASPFSSVYPPNIIAYYPWIKFLFDHHKYTEHFVEYIDILVGPDRLISFYWQNNILCYLQDIPFKTPQDIIYHTLSFKNLCGVDKEITIRLKGFINQESEIVNQLKAFFPLLYVNTLLVY